MRSRALLLLLTGGMALAMMASASADTSTPVKSGLRGSRVQSANCSVATVSGNDVRIVGHVRSIRVCPTAMLTGAVLSAARRPVVFRAMRSALSARDGAARADQFCTFYADIPRLVYVVTSKGAWVVHLPVDSCGHYTKAVVAALQMSV